jgi:maltose alpha-D-glucosyltransferase / alpha-amylase
MENSDKKYWWKNIVIYEVYVDKFADTFSGLAGKLDYLKSFGISCIHLLPHYPSPMFDDGYDITDYKNVRQDLGTLDDFKQFVENAHKLGIKVIVDFVLNHTSTRHPWFIEARSSKNNSKRDFYLWSKTGKELATAPNLFPDIKNNNWIYNSPTNDYYFSTFHQEQADVNWDNPEVFDQMMSILDFWVALGVDGFRLDAVSHLIKREDTICDGLPETHALLKKIRAYLDSRYNGIILLAEVGGSIPETKKYFSQGDECHLVYNFPLVGYLLMALKNESKTLPKAFLDSMADIPKNCAFANFLGHHDEMALGMMDKKEQDELLVHFDPDSKHRFASGISLRMATMLSGDKIKIKEAFDLLVSVPGVPIIYYGDEVGMENDVLHQEEKDTRKSMRAKFDWNTKGRDESGKPLFLRM